ncbi:MAG TPA: monovalent cation/H+ antiporter subunit D [Methylophilaceae bacterium]|jgi:multicomponent K+:H+ antiporter subunit D
MHSPILPVLIPFFAAIVLLTGKGGICLQRSISALAMALLLFAAGHLLWLTDSGAPLSYTLGDWMPPFGITLVADRLSALGVIITAVLATAALLYASSGYDLEGRHFHAIFHLQLVGINGAFLTGDVFNLFVFFEIMLLASYILLVHGHGLQKSRANFAYVTLNLAGSAVFLIALGLIYGTLGTLNLADIALQLQQIDAGRSALVRTAGALLIAVFALKAALLPLSFWLPAAYTAASPAVAALFAIMTKVGIVAILRVQHIAFASAPTMHGLIGDWMVVAALATIIVATLGVLSSKRLQALISWLVLGSAGLLLVVPAQGDALVTAAALYYLTQSAIVGAAFFMLSGIIHNARPQGGDALLRAERIRSISLQIGFFLLAAAAAGLPPFSGFVGKLMLLSSLSQTSLAAPIWAVVLTTGLLTTVALAKAGSRLFWEKNASPAEKDAVPANDRLQYAATYILIAASLLLVICARPLSDLAQRTAGQLHDPAQYIGAVITDPAAIERTSRP